MTRLFEIQYGKYGHIVAATNLTHQRVLAGTRDPCSKALPRTAASNAMPLYTNVHRVPMRTVSRKILHGVSPSWRLYATSTESFVAAMDGLEAQGVVEPRSISEFGGNGLFVIQVSSK